MVTFIEEEEEEEEEEEVGGTANNATDKTAKNTYFTLGSEFRHQVTLKATF
jgi:hypothetical protein